MKLLSFIVGLVIIWSILFVIMVSVSPFSLAGGLPIGATILSLLWYGICYFDKEEDDKK